MRKFREVSNCPRWDPAETQSPSVSCFLRLALSLLHQSFKPLEDSHLLRNANQTKFPLDYNQIAESSQKCKMGHVKEFLVLFSKLKKFWHFLFIESQNQIINFSKCWGWNYQNKGAPGRRLSPTHHKDEASHLYLSHRNHSPWCVWSLCYALYHLRERPFVLGAGVPCSLVKHQRREGEGNKPSQVFSLLKVLTYVNVNILPEIVRKIPVTLWILSVRLIWEVEKGKVVLGSSQRWDWQPTTTEGRPLNMAGAQWTLGDDCLWSLSPGHPKAHRRSAKYMQAYVRVGLLWKSGRRLRPHLVSSRTEIKHPRNTEQRTRIRKSWEAGISESYETINLPGTCRHLGKDMGLSQGCGIKIRGNFYSC